MRHHHVDLVVGFVLCSCVMSGCSRANEKPVESSSSKPANAVATVAAPADVTPQETKKLLATSKSTVCIYLDVRTVAEFEAGHVPGSWNIPVMTKSETGSMEKNPEFLSQVQAVIPKNSRVIVGCRSGSRSKRAWKMMRSAGYQQISNMLGGFLGKRDSSGTTIHSGWKELGYKIETGDGGDHSYAKLKTGAKP